MQASPYLNKDQVNHAMDISVIVDDRSEFVCGASCAACRNYSFALDKSSENMSTLDPERHYLLHKEKEALMRQQKVSLWTFLGILVLLSAIIGGSSIGTMTNFVPPTNSLVINAWRAGILCLYMAIPTLIETWINWNRVNYSSIFTLRNYSQILITLTTQIAWTTGLLYGSGRMI